LVLVQEYDIQRLLAQCLTDASFGNVLGHVLKISKGLRILDELFPPSSCRTLRSIPSDLYQLEVQW
jgi:hypothetical protein